jgi:DNA polymerase
MGCAPVLSPANGPVPCEILLIGEAPGRFGAGRTGVPFSGDETGRRLTAFVQEAGLSKAALFMTNAALCLPLDPAGNNRAPTKAEIANCSGWLRATIEVVRPRLVVAMGVSALSATNLVANHGLTLRDAGGPPVTWFGRKLAVTYHPGARARVHRSDALQSEDWRALGGWIRRTLPP